MAGRTFVDTNVLVYAAATGGGDKATRARTVIEELASATALVLSTQVLQEFFNVVTRKLGMSAASARSIVEQYSRFDVVVVRPEIILGAIDLHRLHAISFWDALVIRAASAAGCGRVLSEDLQHGQTIDGVRVENPFLATRAGERRARYGARRPRKLHREQRA